MLVSTNFTEKVAPTFADTEYPFFGNQKITPVELKANSLVNTSFVYLPIISRLQTDWANGQLKVFKGAQTISQVMVGIQTDIVGFMKKQGFTNLVIGKLPGESGG